jgi:hypothetical protein
MRNIDWTEPAEAEIKRVVDRMDARLKWEQRRDWILASVLGVAALVLLWTVRW